jgi:thiol-disulfide isomerase/thioredoxin
MRRPILALLISIFLFSCKENPETSESDQIVVIGELSYSPEEISAGKEISLSYPFKKVDTAGEVKAFYKKDNSWYGKGLTIEMRDSLIVSSFEVPNEAKGVVITIPTSDKPLAHNIPLSVDGEMAPQNDLEAKLFELSIASFKEMEVVNKTSKSWDSLVAPLMDKPDLLDDYISQIAYTWNKDDPDSFQKFVDDRVSAFAKAETPSDNRYRSIITLYETTSNGSKADSLRKIAINKYPDGDTAMYAAYSSYFEEEDENKRDSIYTLFKTKNWTEEWPYSNMTSMQAYDASSKEDYEEYDRLIQQLPDYRKASTMNNLAWGLAEKGENLDYAEKISKETIALTQNITPDVIEEFPDLTEKEMESQLEYSRGMYLDTYAYILSKQDKMNEAINAQKQAIELGGGPEYYERLLGYLDKEGKYEEVMSYGLEGWKKSGTTSESKKLIKKAAGKLDKDYDALAAEIIKERAKTTYESTLASMIDEELPAFELMDLDGKKVSKKELEGNIVIMDFWATWCGPCIASFPAMAAAQEEMKDQNVKFVFVNTMEEKSPDEVSEFLSKRDLNFFTVMDRNERGKKSFADKMGINAIPTKVVLDTKGRVRFKDIGWSGSDGKLLEKLKTQVQLINEKSAGAI